LTLSEKHQKEKETNQQKKREKDEICTQLSSSLPYQKKTKEKKNRNKV